MNSIKEALHRKCLEQLQLKLDTVSQRLEEIKVSLLSETKSTAGDKHETGRAMLQIEREKAGRQWAELQEVKHILDKIDPHQTSETVCLGSVVQTTQHHYFIASSFGALSVDNTSYFAISPVTPIGRLLLGKSAGDTITFRTQSFKILSSI